MSGSNGGSWLYAVKAVLWGFLGVRKFDEYEKDVHRLRPMHVVLVGVVMTFLFVAGLMLLVNWIV